MRKVLVVLILFGLLTSCNRFPAAPTVTATQTQPTATRFFPTWTLTFTPTSTSTIPATITITPKPVTSTPEALWTSTPTPPIKALAPLGVALKIAGFDYGQVLDIVPAGKSGKVFLVGGKKLFLLTPGSLDYKILPYDSTYIGTDLTGRTWMIHPQGYTISNWDGTTLRQQELNSGWDVAFPRERGTFPSREFNSDSTGSVWLLTKKDLRAFDGTHWTLYPLHRIGLPNSTDTGETTALSAIGLPGTESILAAGCRFAGDVPVQGITPRILKDGTWQDFTEFGDYPCVTQLGTGDNGTVYAAQTSVLWLYNPDSGWREYSMPRDHEGQFLIGILDVKITKDHAVWVIAAYGDGKTAISSKVVYQLVGESWQSVRVNNQFAVQKLLFKADGQPILWENQQLLRYDPTTPTWVQLTNAEIKAAAADSEGGIWAVTENLRELTVWYQP